MTVIENDGSPAKIHAGMDQGYDPGGRRLDGGAHRGGDINAVMGLAGFTVS